eukprot:5850232-Amphidinium_carterae.1
MLQYFFRLGLWSIGVTYQRNPRLKKKDVLNLSMTTNYGRSWLKEKVSLAMRHDGTRDRVVSNSGP